MPEYPRTGGVIRHQPQIAGLQSPESLAHHCKQAQPRAQTAMTLSSVVASIPCIRSRESAGPMVENVVTDQMVGDRRSPGATILGVEFEYLLRQPSLLGPPTGSEHRDAMWTVYELASPERAHRSSLLDMLFVRRCGVLYRQGLSRRCGVPRSQLLRQWQSFVFVFAASMAVCCGSSSLRYVEQVDEWIPCCSSHDLGLSRSSPSLHL